MSTTPRNPKKQNPGVDCSGANRVLMGMYHGEGLCVGEGYVYHTKKPKKPEPRSGLFGGKQGVNGYVPQ